jgi:hypothetical protein
MQNFLRSRRGANVERIHRNVDIRNLKSHLCDGAPADLAHLSEAVQIHQRGDVARLEPSSSAVRRIATGDVHEIAEGP